MADPTPGNTKAIAAVLAGAIPDYVQGSITTIFTTAAVWFAPHQSGGS